MKENRKWILTTFMLTFVLALVFGGVSNLVVEKMNIFVAVITLLLVIFIGVIFDMIGMAIATCDAAPFHAKASKKHNGAKEVIRLLKNKDRASNICNDLVGDICGILSGSISALIAVKLSSILSIDIVIISLIISAFVATITVGGKAIGKGISMNNSEEIMFKVGAVIHIVRPVKDKK